MAEDKPEYLSAEALRNRLYHSLRDKGAVDTIKSQLRNKIVEELQQSYKGHLSVRDLKLPDEGSLLHRAANSLVADHLRSCQYDYSFSVFLPESRTAKDKIFPTEDILQLLGISPSSRLFKKMVSGKKDHATKGFLWQILCELSALHSNASNETGVQTDLIRVAAVSSLDERLNGVDDFYSSKKDEHFRTSSAAVEDRLMSFQRQLEERYRTDLKLELARMKDNEIARIKMEEKETSRRELEQMRRELERQFQTKNDALLLKERNTMERIQAEQTMHDREIYTQRQSLLDEIEILRKREAEIKREDETNHREAKLNEDRVKTKEEGIRHREQEVRKMEVEHEQRLKNEMTKFKVEEQAKYMERAQNIEIREARVKDEERRVRDEKDKIQEIKDQLRDKTLRVNELETQLHEERHKDMSATRQNEVLNAKLRDMSDYKVLKEQSVVNRNEVETLRTRLAEVLNMNERERGRQEELLRELRRPSPETLMLQRDLEKARENLRQELVIAGSQKTHLENRLQEEMDRNRDLVRRFEEQTITIKEMNRELVDLRSQLTVTHQALTNEVYRKPADDTGAPGVFRGSRSIPLPRTDSDDDLDDEFQRLPGSQYASKLASPKRRSHREYDEDDMMKDIEAEYDLPTSKQGRKLYPGFSEDDRSSTVSADVVAEAKYRLKSLEREAQNLDKAYRDFHYNLTNPSSGPDEQSRSHGRHVIEKEVVSESQKRVASPSASPIHRPMSSTPYQGRQSSQLNDSLRELTEQSTSRKEPPPRFDMSNMSDELNDRTGDERVERPRPITVADLEARPGSPSIVVVPGSESSAATSAMEIDRKDIYKTPTGPSGGKLAPISLDTAWKTPTLEDEWKSKETSNLPPLGGKLPPLSAEKPSLDDNWKSKEDEIKEAEERQRREEEDERRWQEEKRTREEERKKREHEAWEREQQELNKLQGKEFDVMDGGAPEEEEEKKLESEDNIDPVMKQYMEMIQQQKDKEKEVVKKSVDVWSKGHRLSQDTVTQSEQDISVAEDINSNNSEGGGFSDW
ncbi:centriole and centriolar satellite protein OFD1-like [Mytilus edulis]|uniref:centriole and centriolar satellite protein OFD1-like n=1 Tax=Mytilus edulis TaxID=6550 RepID=UPI0039F0368B